MPTCTRLGCGQDFHSSAPCTYHSGTPVFHEGLKFWSCCQQTHKPVTDFDDFLRLPTCCTADRHSDVKVAPLKKEDKERDAGGKSGVDKDGKEYYGQEQSTGAGQGQGQGQALSANHLASLQTMKVAETSKEKGKSSVVAEAPKEYVEQQDPPNAVVSHGSTCKRLGCGVKHTRADGERKRQEEICTYHKGAPIFHEGSKGYSCCSKRVMDFNDFLSIKPCTTSKAGHLFIGSIDEETEEQRRTDGFERVECRMDHYETPKDVHVTIYAKGVDKEDCKVTFKEDQIDISLALPASPSGLKRRYEKQMKPFAPIDASSSTYALTNFKLEMVLVKAQAGQGWLTLEANQRAHGYGTVW